jgi:hypothetical protein
MTQLTEEKFTNRDGFSTKNIAVMALLASVYAAGSFLPGFPMLGLPGSKIDLVRALEIGYGVVLGPIYGPLTAFLGALVGKTLAGGGPGLFFTPLAPVTAFVASMLTRRGGWKIAAAIIASLILVWYALPTGRAAWMVPVLHLTGLLVVLASRESVSEMISSDDRGKLTRGMLLCSLPSTLAGHLLGNIIFAVAFSPSPEFFTAVLPVSAVERGVITILATLIGAPLVLAVRQVYPDLMRAPEKR